MNETNKTCMKCAHRILKDFKHYAYSHCTLRDDKVFAKGKACEHFESVQGEDKNEKMKKIATRLEQLEKEYAEKKIDLESFIRQRSILIGKKEGLDAPKGKENYSFIKTIKI
jgi:predicted ATP-dependent serine protease